MLIFFLVPIIAFLACNKENEIAFKEVPETRQNIDGIRIAWDYSSLTRIAPKSNRAPGYYGYSRMIQLQNKRLACVYETSMGNIELIFSDDLGENWGEPEIIFATENNISMAVPEIIELEDASILIACNPRPQEPYTNDRRFGIKVCKSADGGKTWQPAQQIYQAQETFENGCWEPSFVQLPTGEVQLFFANEGIYTNSGEQNISMLRSNDFGETWTKEPVIAGFRSERRDGMPVPLLLPEQGELLIAVEDNKTGEFKPTIYREKLTDNWSNSVITGDDSRREYHPLNNPLSNEIYAGAPYLTRVETGEVLLSYQTTLNRSLVWDLSAMAVEIGDDSGREFDRQTFPFSIPLSKWGLWNSITVIENNIPVALTSTNAFSQNSTEVWMIKGHIIPELVLPQGTATIDGTFNDDCWQDEMPYFVGHKSEIQLQSSVCYDTENLYLAAVIKNCISANNDNEFVFQIDMERTGYSAPHSGVYTFQINVDGSLNISEGEFGEWKEIEIDDRIQLKTNKFEESCHFEMAVPLDFFTLKWNETKTMGINFSFKSKLLNGVQITENLSLGDSEKPFSWCPLTIE